jgi:hypothetical protein
VPLPPTFSRALFLRHSSPPLSRRHAVPTLYRSFVSVSIRVYVRFPLVPVTRLRRETGAGARKRGEGAHVERVELKTAEFAREARNRAPDPTLRYCSSE